MMTTEKPWLIYGANGFTGRLIAQAALDRGLKPTLAGRSEAKIRPLAEKMGLPWKIARLENKQEVENCLSGHNAVVLAAGPFIETSKPIVDACLNLGLHYVDITGEFPVFQNIYQRDSEATKRKVVLMPGAGFDVIPTDCLARFALDKWPQTTELHLGVKTLGSISAGTAQTVLEMLPQSQEFAYRSGVLVPYPTGTANRNLPFGSGEVSCINAPLSDVLAAYRSTRVPNVTTYLALPPGQQRTIRNWSGLLKNLLAVGPVRQVARWVARQQLKGPSPEQQNTSRSRVSVEAVQPDGKSFFATLETSEGYSLTGRMAVECVVRILNSDLAGSFSPAQAFGADLILVEKGTVRQTLVNGKPTIE